MNKQEFLWALQNGLSGLPQQDVDERLAFYSEMIDDRMEEGLTEEEAVAEIGPTDQIIAQIIEETPLPRIVRERIRPKQSRGAGEILLLVLGFPLWFPLLAAFAAIVFSFYIVIWSLVICLWAVEVALWAAALGGIVVGAALIIRGDSMQGLLMIGAGLVCAGLSVFLFFGCVAATKGMLRLTQRIGGWFKKLFMKKENAR